MFQITRPTRMTLGLGSKLLPNRNSGGKEKMAKRSIAPMEPTIEESECTITKSEISIGNDKQTSRKTSKLSFGGDDVRYYEKVRSSI